MPIPAGFPKALSHPRYNGRDEQFAPLEANNSGELGYFLSLGFFALLRFNCEEGGFVFDNTPSVPAVFSGSDLPPGTSWGSVENAAADLLSRQPLVLS